MRAGGVAGVRSCPAGEFRAYFPIEKSLKSLEFFFSDISQGREKMRVYSSKKELKKHKSRISVSGF